jgi:hypothetical protein
MSNTFHFDFLKSLIPSIGKITDEYLDEFVAQHSDLKLPVLESLQDILSTIMLKMFFGADLKGRLIDGKNVPSFVSDIVADGTRQSVELVTILFGQGFTSLGLRARDRDINRRLKLFREFGVTMVNEKVQ